MGNGEWGMGNGEWGMGEMGKCDAQPTTVLGRTFPVPRRVVRASRNVAAVVGLELEGRVDGAARGRRGPDRVLERVAQPDLGVVRHGVRVDGLDHVLQEHVRLGGAALEPTSKSERSCKEMLDELDKDSNLHYFISPDR